jgi:ribonuclease P protein component
MLKKTFRLLGPIPKNANSYSTPFFSLKVSKNSEEVSRFGFLVSKKIDKRAVVRNRAKRILRGCVERSLSQIKGGYDFLFIARKDLVGKSTSEINTVLLDILKREKLYD